MIGFNGGLIGADRTISLAEAAGVWTPAEQIQAQRNGLWPLVGSGKLLTDYPGASAAYSLRLLRATYAGSLVTVRRSSDNATEDFNETQINGSGAGSLTNFCSGTNGFVATWHDQSGNGNNATQTDGSIQPQIVTSGTVNTLNGKPCLTFNNNGNTFLIFNTRLTNIISVFQVLNIDSTQVNALTFLLGDSSAFDYHGGNTTWLTGTAKTEVKNGSNRLNDAITDLLTTNRVSSQVLISMIHTGSASVSRISKDRGENGRSIRGNMQELVLYSTSQTSNVSPINANINAYYSIY